MSTITLPEELEGQHPMASRRSQKSNTTVGGHRITETTAAGTDHLGYIIENIILTNTTGSGANEACTLTIGGVAYALGGFTVGTPKSWKEFCPIQVPPDTAWEVKCQADDLTAGKLLITYDRD